MKKAPSYDKTESTSKIKDALKPVPKKSDSKKDPAYEKDHKMVKGRFKFHEVPGGELKFSYVKYQNDTDKPWVMKDGETYEVPYMVAKHLNQGGKYPIHRHAVDEEGRPSQVIGQMVDRFGFEPIGFFDDEDLHPSPNLLTVKNL